MISPVTHVVKRPALTAVYAFLAVTGVVLRWPTMNFPLSEAHAFRQFQTTLMIRELMDGGVWQLSPLPVLGPPWQVPMEFPLFQWIGAVGGTIVGAAPQIAGRLTALVFFMISAALMAVMATRLYSRVVGLIAFGLFMFLPFGWQWGNAPLIEFAATAGAVASFYVIMLWVERRSRWLLVLLTFTLAFMALVKITTAVVWVIPLLAVSVWWGTTSGKRSIYSRWPLAVPLSVSGILAVAWTRYSDGFKASHQFTEFLTSESLTTWNFGTIDQRLGTRNWFRIAEYSESIVGLLVIFFVLLTAAVALWGFRPITVALASTLFIGPLVFFNLYYMHSYYLAAVYPALVLVVAAGIGGIARSLQDRSARMLASLVMAFSVLVMAWISPEGQLVSQRTSEGLYQFPLAEEIANNTPADAGVIAIGCDWDPAYPYLSGRRMLMLSGRNPDESIPPEWIGPELTYIASCAEGIDPRDATGINNPLVQVSPHIWRIVF